MSTITQASELASQQAVELGELLASTVVSVAAAQEGLDRHATQRLDAMERGDADAPRVPPLWYTFTDVSLEVALSASVQRATANAPAQLMSRPVDPRQVAGRIEPVIGEGSRRRDQPDLVPVVQGAHAHAHEFGHPAHGQRGRGHHVIGHVHSISFLALCTLVHDAA